MANILSTAARMVKTALLPEATKHVEWMLAEADKWREPSGEEYRTEIARRRNYLDGEMEADGLSLLKEEFAKTYADMDYKMIQYPIAKLVWTKKAKVFSGLGARLYLVDQATGKEVDPESRPALDYAYMNESSENDTTSISIDQTLESMHCCAVRPCWAGDRIEDNIFDSDKVHFVVNTARENDPYASQAVLFERAGDEGVNDTSPRYEVWGSRDPLVSLETDCDGSQIYTPDMHYVTSTKDSWRVNEMDENPYRDRHTGRAVYPFTWYRDNRQSIYNKGGDDLVRLTRVINMGLTYLNHNMIWQMAVIPVVEQPQGGLDADMEEKLRAIVLSSPNKMMDLPPGCKLTFVKPDGQLEQFTTVYEMLIQYAALMNQLSPRSIDIRNGLPQSGVAMRIEFDSLIKHRDERVKIYRRHVLDHQEKKIMVWNYNEKNLPKGRRPIPDNLVPMWSPGQMESGPTDYVELGNRFEREVDADVSSIDDWAAAVWNLPPDQARARVDANAKRNAELRKVGIIEPPPLEDDLEIDDLIEDDETKDEPEE